MSFAHAEPESGASAKPNLGIFADPIAQFASPGEEAVGDLLVQAMSLMGVAYRFGGSSPETGLDCSGFIQYVFRKSLRVNLPRTSAEMARAGREIDRSELAPGDLVFYNTRGFKYSHVGLYMGGGKFIHSPRTGKSVEVVSMSSNYWVQRFNGARRVSRGGVIESPAKRAAKEHGSESNQSSVASVRGKKKAEAVVERKGRKAKAEPVVSERKGRKAKTEALRKSSKHSDRAEKRKARVEQSQRAKKTKTSEKAAHKKKKQEE